MNVALIHLGLVLVAQALPLSVSDLLANPDRFDGQPVTVTGTISDFRGNPFRRRGPKYTFDLSDGTGTILVVVYGMPPPCESGAVTVEGTFEQRKRRVETSDSYYNFKIVTLNVICLPEREPKTK